MGFYPRLTHLRSKVFGRKGMLTFRDGFIRKLVHVDFYSSTMLLTDVRVGTKGTVPREAELKNRV